MFSHEESLLAEVNISHWKELALNGNDDFIRVFSKQVYDISVLIIPFLLMIPHLKEDINNTVKKKLPHYKDEIQKLKNESYTTIISSIISFLLYAVKQAMVFSCKVFIVTTVCFFLAIFLVTVASNKQFVDDIIRGIMSFLLSSAQLVLSDDSIIIIILFLQSSVKLVFSYAIIISRNISLSLTLMKVVFSYAIIIYSIITFSHSSVEQEFTCIVLITLGFIPKFPELLFSCAILCGTIILFSPYLELVFQKLKVLINYASRLEAGSKLEKERLHETVDQLQEDQLKIAQQEWPFELTWYNDEQRQFTIDDQQKLQDDQEKLEDKQEFIKIQEELDTDQQNATVDKEEFINVQEQLNTDQQNATVDKEEFVKKQEFINVQEQLNTHQQNATVDKEEFIKKQEFINVQEQLNTDQQNATVDKEEFIKKQEFINVQEQLNTDQQNATVDKQEFINVQEQLNTDRQNATIDNEASNDEQRQLQIQKLKDEYLQQLQRKGHICAKNCVLCSILWSCQQELGFYLCGPQLILIMFLHAAEKNKREYLKCEKFIEIFMKCKVIDAPVGCEYLWSEEMSKKSEMIEKAWNALMNMDKSVCLIGIKSSKALGGGHCVVCDLNTRTGCGTVTFHDPQKEEKAEWSKTEFIFYLDDPNIAGLRLFTVNLQKLKDIIDEYSEILHHTDKSNQTLSPMPLRV
ncbi:Hypothetical predicted protein [Paramuricea clavata]|uniref:Uncharacterized protein n=1 Tax=Paramuricea clavata TaxID=317549 RepID=A0A6S7GGS2_PARCT|nr:Hypothetical predicted protein [Paramuricea clavata]